MRAPGAGAPCSRLAPLLHGPDAPRFDV